MLILTDAAIRRWCGPRWRIGASRRTRVAAVLAELQAQYLDDLARGEFKAGPLSLENPPAGMGELQLTPEGVISSTYGTLEFLTPIAELNLDMVTPEERNAYDFFRSRYQRSWREFFDPIALRFVIQPDRMGIDLSVMPLIVGSE